MVEDSHIMGARISEKGNWGPENASKSMSPVTYFLQLHSTP